jgi:hypothetical protein
MMPEPYAGKLWKKRQGIRAGYTYITIEELIGSSKVLVLTALDVLTKTKEEIKT